MRGRRRREVMAVAALSLSLSLTRPRPTAAACRGVSTGMQRCGFPLAGLYRTTTTTTTAASPSLRLAIQIFASLRS